MSKTLTSRSAVTPETELEGNPGSRRQKRGSKRMKEFGYKRVEIWLDSKERELIEDYCWLANKAVSTFIRRLAFETAAAELPKFGKAQQEQLKRRKANAGRIPVTRKS